jgi:dephospho-CoA kinase
METHPRFAIGLTGGIGSGKSLVADGFGRHGASVIDTDLIAHQLTAAGGLALPALRSAFGPECIAEDGAMDRAAMRKRVFSDANQRRLLESIVHPLIGEQVQLAAAQASGDYLVFVVPLLVESGRWKDRVDRVLVVDCPESLQIERVVQRNGLPREQILAILQAQASRAERLAAADDVIVNDADLESVEREVERLHQTYLAFAAAKR